MIVSSGKQLTVSGAGQFLFCSLSGVLGFYLSGFDLEVSTPEQPFNDCFCNYNTHLSC
jgi:hypothetical protein